MNFDRMPPNAVDVEETLLAACFVSPDTVDTISEIITPDDFYKTAHSKIFRTMVEMRDRKEPVDLAAVFTRLKDQGQAEEVGGAAYLSSIINDVPMSTDVKYYAGVVKDKAILRAIIKQASQTIQDAFESQNSADLLDTAQQRFLDIHNPLRFKFQTMADVVSLAVDHIEKCSTGNQDIALPTGLVDLDNNMGGGLRGPKFTVICARPGIGKTAIMLNIAGSIAANFRNRNCGGKVGVMELEMTDEELGIRAIAMSSGINTVYLFAGREKVGDAWGPLGPSRWQAISETASRISEYPVLFDDTPALPLQEVVRRARMMHKEGCRIIFIDQLSKIRGPGGKEYEQKTAIVNRLAELKKELRIPIVLLAQINREGWLKSTGALEEDADIIMRLRQTDTALDQNGEVFAASLTIEKHRGGPTGEISLQWWPKITAFRNHADTIGA